METRCQSAFPEATRAPHPPRPKIPFSRSIFQPPTHEGRVDVGDGLKSSDGGQVLRHEAKRRLDLAVHRAPVSGWDCLPDGAIDRPDGVVCRLRHIAIRIGREQGSLFADGEAVRRFCVVTDRDDPESGDAGDLWSGRPAAASRPSRARPPACWSRTRAKSGCRGSGSRVPGRRSDRPAFTPCTLEVPWKGERDLDRLYAPEATDMLAELRH